MKNIYEVFDEFELAKNKKERMEVIGRNLSKTLHDVLLLTYHPDYQWKIKQFPEQYVPNLDNKNGFSYLQLSTELRKLYLFQIGDPTAEKLDERKRNEILIQMLESLEPREAEVLNGIFNKDQHVRHLDYDFVKEAFPDMLP